MRFLRMVAFGGRIPPAVALAHVGYVTLADSSVMDHPLTLPICYPIH